MASTNLLRLKQYWPEDSARNVILYDSHVTPKSQLETRPYYRITYESNLDMIHIVKYSPRNHSRSPQQQQQQQKQKQKDYDHDVVAEIDPSDVVGADLEVKFAQDAFLESPASLANLKALKTARNMAKSHTSKQQDCNTIAIKPLTVACGDDTTNTDTITYQEFLERKKRMQVQNSAAFRQVGVYNRKYHSRSSSNQMEIPTGTQHTPSFIHTFFSRYSCSTDTTLDRPTTTVVGEEDDDSPSATDHGDTDDDHDDDDDNNSYEIHLRQDLSPIQTHAVTYLNIYVYPPQDTTAQSSSVLGPRQAKHVRFHVAPTIDFLDARNVVRGIRILAQIEHYCKEEMGQRIADAQKKTQSSKTPLPTKKQPIPPKYLVILNAFSGKKNATDVYEHTLRPMLEQSGIDHDLFVSLYPGHTYERMSALFAILAARNKLHDVDDEASSDTDMSVDLLDISEYDGIVVLGGDGTVFEVLQGIRSRKKDRNDLMKRLKFGIVGCGRYNGLSSSLLYASKVKYPFVLWYYETNHH